MPGVSRRLVVGVLGTGVVAAPAMAQTYGGNAPICLHKWFWGGGSTYYCEYASIAQCQATAAGLPATCDANPYFASAQTPRGAYRAPRNAY